MVSCRNQRHFREPGKYINVPAMKTITLASAKGGVAKSASAISISYVLSQLGHKVLLIDSDPQNAATRHFVEDFAGIEYKTTRQLLLKEAYLQDCLIPVYDGVDFIPSQLRLLNIEKELADENNPLFILHDILTEVDDQYDYCVIDTAPWMGLMTRSALICSDIVIIPTLLEKWPVEAIQRLVLCGCDSAATCVLYDGSCNAVAGVAEDSPWLRSRGSRFSTPASSAGRHYQ